MGLGAAWLFAASNGGGRLVIESVSVPPGGNGGNTVLPSRSLVLPVTMAPFGVSEDASRGVTNPLTALSGFVSEIFRPRTTLAGNAPMDAALPAGPGGSIAASAGGTPGSASPVGPADGVPFYSSAYDTPGAYYDPISGQWYAH